MEVIRLGLDELMACQELDQIALGGIWNKKHWSYELSTPSRLSLGIMNRSKLLAIACGSIVIDELHITAIAVHPERRREGLGALILSSLMTKAKLGGVKTATLEVSKENLAAIALYNRCGFISSGYRINYYHNGNDAIIQSCLLVASSGVNQDGS